MKRFLWLLPILASGCSGDLSQGAASSALEEHLVAVAPTVYEDIRPTVFVESIFQPDENNRRISFHVEGSETPKPEGRAYMLAYFQRTNDGWALTGYGPDLAKGIAYLRARYWRDRYKGIMAVLDTLVDEARYWARERQIVSYEVMPGNLREFEFRSNQWKEGIPNDTLRSIVSEKAIEIPDTLEWAIEKPGTASHYSALWVRKKNSAVSCGRRISGGKPSGSVPDLWVHKYRTTCDGLGFRYVWGEAQDSILRQILTSGGVLRP